MVNKDKFDALESVSGDRSIFTHITVALLTFALSLGVEMGITYAATGDQTAGAILVVCVAAGFFGLVSGYFAWLKWSKYNTLRSGLFDDQNLIADDTIVTTSDGSSVRIDHLNSGGSS